MKHIIHIMMMMGICLWKYIERLIKFTLNKHLKNKTKKKLLDSVTKIFVYFKLKFSRNEKKKEKTSINNKSLCHYPHSHHSQSIFLQLLPFKINLSLIINIRRIWTKIKKHNRMLMQPLPYPIQHFNRFKQKDIGR